jgi:hypothetical protein
MGQPSTIDVLNAIVSGTQDPLNAILGGPIASHRKDMKPARVLPPPLTEEEKATLIIRGNEYKSLLKVGTWIAEFTKADGTDTVMECTLDPKILPPGEATAKQTTRSPQPHLVYCFAVDREGWRAFDIRRLKQFYKKPESL